MKESFVFYLTHYEAIKNLSVTDKGLLFDAICNYAFKGEMNNNLPPVVSMAFMFIKQQLDRDLIKYNSVVERNRVNGSSGGRPKKENPNNPVGFLETQPITQKPKKVDNEDDMIDENEKKNEKEEGEISHPQFQKRFLLQISEVENFLKSDAAWKDIVCMQNHYSIAEIDNYIFTFTELLKARGETEKTPNDAKNHFTNWLNKQKANNKQPSKRNLNTTINHSDEKL